MQKYFFGNPAELSNTIHEKSRQEIQNINDRDKRLSIILIKSLLKDGADIDDAIIQIKMEANGITLDDLK